MRIRSIKPEFWRSQDISRLPRDVRLLFAGLWSYVDDNGVGVDDHRAIAADLFAYDEDPREAREFVRDGLARLSDDTLTSDGVPLVVRYEVAGKSLLFISKWDKHQRIDKPARPRFPRPEPATSDYRTPREDPRPSQEDIATLSRHSRDTPATGTGEQGSRGAGEKPTRSPRSGEQRPEGFEAFWTAYPRKVGKQAAAKAYAKATKTVSPERITQGALRYATYCAEVGRDPEHIAHPTTWLHAGRWDDQLGEEPARPAHDPHTHPVEWLKGQWKEGAVQEIERLTSLRYPRPDPPSDPPPADFSAWRRDDKRAWITAHREQITRELEASRVAA